MNRLEMPPPKLNSWLRAKPPNLKTAKTSGSTVYLGYVALIQFSVAINSCMSEEMWGKYELTSLFLPLPPSIYLPLPPSTSLYFPLSPSTFLYIPSFTSLYLPLPPSTSLYLPLPLSTSLPTSTSLYLPLAQLLCKGDQLRHTEKDSHLLQARHSIRGGDHVRLQVPHRGRQDPVSVWSSKLQRDFKLMSHDITCNVSPCDMLCLYICVYDMYIRYFQMYSWPLVPNFKQFLC